jgi:hypothetical protein
MPIILRTGEREIFLKIECSRFQWSISLGYTGVLARHYGHARVAFAPKVSIAAIGIEDCMKVQSVGKKRTETER